MTRRLIPQKRSFPTTLFFRYFSPYLIVSTNVNKKLRPWSNLSFSIHNHHKTIFIKYLGYYPRVPCSIHMFNYYGTKIVHEHYVREWVNNYPQCSCICVSASSTVVFTCIARRGSLLITTVQVWSCSVSSFVPTVTLTMAAPLFVCTEEEQRSVIRFLWSEGASGAEIHRRPSAQYGNSVLPQRGVYEWIEKFKNDRISFRHEGSGTCVVRCSAKNIFFWGHKEACATMEEVHWKARRLCWKMVLL